MKIRGPSYFQEVAVYSKRVDTIVTRVSGQDCGREWHRSNANIGGTHDRIF